MLRGSDRDALAEILTAERSLIARGNGRSYGDAALNPAATVSMLQHDRIFTFDPDIGRVTCESGVLLADLLRLFVPRGWFPRVTPGTWFVTVGGLVASDVHGKNHHRAGSFCRHVERLELMRGDGQVVVCSRDENPELFAATCGGMGLTGIILTVTFCMLPVETAHVRQRTLRAANLEEILAAFDGYAGATYSLAWIDCLARGEARGRSVLMLGEHAALDELPARARRRPLAVRLRRRVRVPFHLPRAVVGRHAVRAFNVLYHRRARPGTRIVPYEGFFYPLDAIADWNRIYGRRGFVQHQSVLPKEAGKEGLARMLSTLAGAKSGTFLAVLKLLGPRQADDGMLSFPMEGYTLALDFPADEDGFRVLAELDAIVLDHGGRMYLAKDSRMDARTFRRGYPELDRFLAVRAAHGGERFSSRLAERLGL